MNFNEWIKVYKKINKSEYFENEISPQLINLIKNYSKKYTIIRIKNKCVNNALRNLTTMSRIIISLDAEFQTVLDESMPYTEINFKGDKVAPMIRELGMMIFLMDKKDMVWYYIGNLHVNFNIYSDVYKIRYLLSKYCTVTDNTRKIMENNDKFFDVSQIYNLSKGQIYKIINKSFLVNEFTNNKDKILDIIQSNNQLFDKDKYMIQRLLRNIPFEVYGEYIKGTKYEDIFTTQFDLYMGDKLVKDRLLSHEQELLLLDILYKLTPYTCIVLKGKRDMYALNNTVKYTGYTNNINFTDIYDIEIFNAFSRNNYGNAQLETTYNGLIETDIYHKHVRREFKHIQRSIGGDAHNPVVDSLFTIIVAIVINIGMNLSM